MQIQITNEPKTKIKTSLEYIPKYGPEPRGQNYAFDEVLELAGAAEFCRDFKQLPGDNVWACSREVYDTWGEILRTRAEIEIIVNETVAARGAFEIGEWFADFEGHESTPGRDGALEDARRLLADLKRDFPAVLPVATPADVFAAKSVYNDCTTIDPPDPTGKIRVTLAPLGDEIATGWFLAEDKKEAATGTHGGLYWGRVIFRTDAADPERDRACEVAAVDRGKYRVLYIV